MSLELLRCIEWNVFLLQAPKRDGVGGIGATEEVVSVKRPLKACKGKRKEASFQKAWTCYKLGTHKKALEAAGGQGPPFTKGPLVFETTGAMGKETQK